MSATFENQMAYNNFVALCRIEVAEKHPEAYEKCFPKVGMDAKGNWTTDKRAWV